MNVIQASVRVPATSDVRSDGGAYFRFKLRGTSAYAYYERTPAHTSKTAFTVPWSSGSLVTCANFCIVRQHVGGIYSGEDAHTPHHSTRCRYQTQLSDIHLNYGTLSENACGRSISPGAPIECKDPHQERYITVIVGFS